MLERNNIVKFILRIINNQIKLFTKKNMMFQMRETFRMYMHSHNLSARLWNKLQQLMGKSLFKFRKIFKKK